MCFKPADKGQSLVVLKKKKELYIQEGQLQLSDPFCLLLKKQRRFYVSKNVIVKT